jgi:hypothetical protein
VRQLSIHGVTIMHNVRDPPPGANRGEKNPTTGVTKHFWAPHK